MLDRTGLPSPTETYCAEEMYRTLAAFFALALLAFLYLAAAAPQGPSQPALMDADERLKSEVSIPPGIYYLGEIAERISRSSGISFCFRGPRGASDDRFVIKFERASVRDVMLALWSCLSYSRASWSWNAAGSKAELAYSIVASTSSERLTKELNAWMENRFREELTILLEALHKSPGERLSLLKEKLEPLLPEESSLISHLAEDWTIWAGLSILDAVPEKEREAILSSDNPLRIPVDKLPPDARKFERYVWSRGSVQRIGESGLLHKLEGSSYAEIQTIRGGTMTPPTLLIGFEHKGSLAYCGGPPLHRVFERMLRKQWLLDSESVESPLGSSRLDSRIDVPSKPPPGRRLGFEDRVLQFAADAPVSVVGRLPSPENWNPIAIEDFARARPRDRRRAGGWDLSTVKGNLENLKANGMMHKWRGKTLILSAVDWMLPEEQRARIPWAEIKRLRAKVKEGGGFLPFREALLTLAKANREQIPLLALELPELANLTRLYPLLNRIGDNRLKLNALISETGLPLDDSVREAIKPLHLPEVPEAIGLYVKEGESTIPIKGFDKGRRVTFGYVLRNREKRSLMSVPRLPSRKPAAETDR